MDNFSRKNKITIIKKKIASRPFRIEMNMYYLHFKQLVRLLSGTLSEAQVFYLKIIVRANFHTVRYLHIRHARLMKIKFRRRTGNKKICFKLTAEQLIPRCASLKTFL